MHYNNTTNGGFIELFNALSLKEVASIVNSLGERVKRFYEVEMSDVKRAIVARQSMINAMNNSVLNSEELETVATQFKKEAIGTCYRK